MTKRKSNFELMRIIAILMIIIWHIIVHGFTMENSTNLNFIFLNEVIKFLVIVHVNLFILLAGYFGVSTSFKLSKVLSLLYQTLFYTIVIMTILSGLGYIHLSKVEIFKELLLLNGFHQYWFIKAYLFLYCVSPFLNKLINSLSKENYHRLLLTNFLLMSIIPYVTGNKGFIMNDGYTLYNFIFLYFLGAYLKIYPLRESYLFKKLTDNAYKFILIIIYLSMAILNFLIFKTSKVLINNNTIFKDIFTNLIEETFHYENPFIIIQSIALFCYFEKLEIKNKGINYLASTTFGIYLFHENIYLRGHLYKWLKINDGKIYSTRFLCYMLLIMILIFVIGFLIEVIRQGIFKFIAKRKWIQKKRQKFRDDIASLGIKVNW